MKNIILLGFMGTGKTTIGKILAKKLEFKFIDVDEIIEERIGKSISKIFKEDGEKKFRIIEKEVVRDVSKLKNTIISTGGGVVLLEKNVNNLRKNGILISLMSSPESILKRVIKDKKRPLLNYSNKLKTIKKLLDFRFPYYVNNVDYIIDTSNLSPNKIVKKILCLKELT
ncbi:MAG: shikimate kinase [Candidatus Firestonebacteria bacterium]